MYGRDPPNKGESWANFGLYFVMPLVIFLFWMAEQHGWFGFGS